MRRLLAIAVLASLAACSEKAPPANTGVVSEAAAPPTVAEAPAPAPAAPSAAEKPDSKWTPPPFQTETPPAFVDKVWRVAPGGEQEAGTRYTFLRDGTLVVDAPHGTPSRGTWRYAGDKVTMIEEGVAHPADVITLDATHFVLRSYNPGGSVDIRMEADASAPVPRP